DTVAGSLPVVVNVGQSGTRATVRAATDAVRRGATAVASTPPHYFPHSQPDIERHYRALKDAVGDVPLLAYNIPQHVQPQVSAALVLALAVEGILHGIKDSQNDLQWFRRLALAVDRGGVADSFSLLLGSRSLLDVARQVGADGVV